MIVKRKLFSVMDEEGNQGYYLYNEATGEEKLFSVVEEEREFGLSSKALGFLSPGAYQAKEAAKYAYDDDDYKKKRVGYALRGAFTPITATVLKKKVEKMAENGASKKEIREYLEKNSGGKHLAVGVGEVLANTITNGATGSLGNLGATVVGVSDKITGNRAKRNKK